MGSSRPSLFAYAAMFLETVGGVCLIIGLFTRFFAAALAIEMLIALIFVHLPKGYAAGGGGYEYVLLIGVVMFRHRHPWRRPLLGRRQDRQGTLTHRAIAKARAAHAARALRTHTLLSWKAAPP